MSEVDDIEEGRNQRLTINLRVAVRLLLFRRRSANVGSAHGQDGSAEAEASQNQKGFDYVRYCSFERSAHEPLHASEHQRAAGKDPGEALDRLKVNSAIDNPSSFFTASSLNRRANDLSSLLDGMQQGVKTLEAADNAHEVDHQDRRSDAGQHSAGAPGQVVQGSLLHPRHVNGGTFTAKNLSFSGGAVGTTAVSVAAVTADVGGTRSSVVQSAAYAAPTAAAKATLTGTVDLSAGTFAQAVDVTISYAGTDTTSLNVGLANGSNESDALATIQTAIAGSALNGKITASLDGSNQLKLTAVDNADAVITVADNGTAGSADALMGAGRASVTGSDGKHAFTVNGTTVTLTSQTDVASAVAKANADLGATHAVEAYDFKRFARVPQQIFGHDQHHPRQRGGLEDRQHGRQRRSLHHRSGGRHRGYDSRCR